MTNNPAGYYKTPTHDPDEDSGLRTPTAHDSALDQELRKLGNTMAHQGEEMAKMRNHEREMVSRIYGLEGEVRDLRNALAELQKALLLFAVEGDS